MRIDIYSSILIIACILYLILVTITCNYLKTLYGFEFFAYLFILSIISYILALFMMLFVYYLNDLKKNKLSERL